MQTLGDTLPDGKHFTLFRGVAGNGKNRRIKSFSWTDSPYIAAWFAKRYTGLEDPAVYEITVQRNQILAFSNERKESEFILQLPLTVKPKRLEEMPKPHKAVTE